MRAAVLLFLVAGCAAAPARPPAASPAPREDPRCAALRLQADLMAEQQVLSVAGLNVADVDLARARELGATYALLCH